MTEGRAYEASEEVMLFSMIEEFVAGGEEIIVLFLKGERSIYGIKLSGRYRAFGSTEGTQESKISDSAISR